MDVEDLPDVNDREAIRLFAADFDGYQHFGSFQACAAAAKAASRDSIASLRNELFFRIAHQIIKAPTISLGHMPSCCPISMRD